jgi:hypothetical protein
MLAESEDSGDDGSSVGVAAALPPWYRLLPADSPTIPYL